MQEQRRAPARTLPSPHVPDVCLSTPHGSFCPLPQVHGGGLSEEAIAYICAESLKVKPPGSCCDGALLALALAVTRE